MPYFIKKVRVELWDTYVCEANDAAEVRTQRHDARRAIFLGNTIGIADGEILVYGPFATFAEAEDDDCAIVETPPAQFLAVG